MAGFIKGEFCRLTCADFPSTKFLLGLEDGGGVASAVGMPADKLEVLRVVALEFVADVEEHPCWHASAVVVVAQLYLYSHHEVHLLPAEEVGGAVGDVGLGGGKSACVHVAAAVHPTARVECLCRLGELECAVLVPDPTEEFVGVLEVSLQFARHFGRVKPRAYADVKSQLNLGAELVGVAPHSVGQNNLQNNLQVLKISKRCVFICENK